MVVSVETLVCYALTLVLRRLSDSGAPLQQIIRKDRTARLQVDEETPKSELVGTSLDWRRAFRHRQTCTLGASRRQRGTQRWFWESTLTISRPTIDVDGRG